jgi:hypothetical protein
VRHTGRGLPFPNRQAAASRGPAEVGEIKLHHPSPASGQDADGLATACLPAITARLRAGLARSKARQVSRAHPGTRPAVPERP